MGTLSLTTLLSSITLLPRDWTRGAGTQRSSGKRSIHCIAKLVQNDHAKRPTSSRRSPPMGASLPSHLWISLVSYPVPYAHLPVPLMHHHRRFALGLPSAHHILRIGNSLKRPVVGPFELCGQSLWGRSPMCRTSKCFRSP